MSHNKKKLSASVSKGALLTALGDKLYLKKQEKIKSAYEVYCQENFKGVKKDFDKVFSFEVIQKMVESFEIEPKEHEEAFKEKLAQGLYQLGRSSKTARRLIPILPYKQKIELKNGMKNHRAFTLPDDETIYFNQELEGGLFLKEIAITILHEASHVLEQKEIMPFGFSDKAYCDQYGVSVQRRVKNFSAEDIFKCDRLLEAEKLVWEEQIWADQYRLIQVPISCLKVLLKCKQNYKGILETLRLIFPFRIDEDKENQEIRMFRAMATKFKRMKIWAKEALKSPFSLLSKQKREALSEKAFNQAVAERLRELLLPQKEEKDENKSGEKMSLFNRFIKKSVWVFGLGINLYILYGMARFLNLDQALITSQALDGPFLSLMKEALLGTGAMLPKIGFSCLALGGVGMGKQLFDKTLQLANDLSKNARDNWCFQYNEQAYRVSVSLNLMRHSNKKGMDLFAGAFCHKYQQALKKEDILLSQTDSGEMEKEIKTRRLVTALTKEVQDDLIFLAQEAAICQPKKDQETPSEVFLSYQKSLLLNVRKIYLDQKKKVPFQKVVIDYLVKEINESEQFKNVAKEVPLSPLKSIRTPALKKALLARILKYRQKELAQQRKDIFSLQKDYLKLLIKKGQENQHQ
ncbi:MAG: hypothetical protein IKL90_02860 [Alphaproteobacteria bacterium]|nr:hypothetical protein [Alphaproteobacteria bacterium]